MMVQFGSYFTSGNLTLLPQSIYICTMNRLRIAARSALYIYVKGTSPILLESAFDTISRCKWFGNQTYTDKDMTIEMRQFISGD